jgi:hypothetical protein
VIFPKPTLPARHAPGVLYWLRSNIRFRTLDVPNKVSALIVNDARSELSGVLVVFVWGLSLGGVKSVCDTTKRQ